MILITGGLGFVGANTAQALLDLGESCVLTRHNNDYIPAFLADYLDRQVFIEPVDVTDYLALTGLGKKYPISGIVHLTTGSMQAGRGSSALELAKDLENTIHSIATVVQAAHDWQVRRVSIAGAPVIYNGVTTLPWRDDQPLPLTAAFPMEAAKKCGEIVASYLGLYAQVECIEIRLAAMYGPNYNPARSSLVGRLVHAAVKGKDPDLGSIRFGSVYAADSGDQCYIKDAARGIALLQTAEKLNHHVYNVSSGRPTTNRDIVTAVQKIIPGFEVNLPEGHMPGLAPEPWYFDIARVQEETGYRPQFDIEAGVSDYIEWLRAGNER
ncbi:MAG: NAD(P)-dependent oxidoreductase [Chloroflexi bacterium]|nr:NAD(P)-dependent oxidoreductase [Chloroflexota bacterium]OJV88704.1 MAG: hypothetical protein BGO39_04150 [Chloroflexi bacterium 54-19]